MSHTPEERHYLALKKSLLDLRRTYAEAKCRIIERYMYEHFPQVGATTNTDKDTYEVEITIPSFVESTTCSEIAEQVRTYLAELEKREAQA